MNSTEKRKEFEEKLNCILKDTTQFTFPFLANQDKKKVIIVEKKQYVEDKLRDVLPENFLDEETLKELWQEAVKHADKQFETLSEKHRLNGFYLQELMHYYVERIGETVLNTI